MLQTDFLAAIRANVTICRPQAFVTTRHGTLGLFWPAGTNGNLSGAVTAVNMSLKNQVCVFIAHHFQARIANRTDNDLLITLSFVWAVMIIKTKMLLAKDLAT